MVTLFQLSALRQHRQQHHGVGMLSCFLNCKELPSTYALLPSPFLRMLPQESLYKSKRITNTMCRGWHGIHVANILLVRVPIEAAGSTSRTKPSPKETSSRKCIAATALGKGRFPMRRILTANHLQPTDSSSTRLSPRMSPFTSLLCSDSLPNFHTPNRFFRRLTWTVDGSFLITPMGQHQVNSEQQPYPVTYLCHRNKLNTYCIPALSSQQQEVLNNTTNNNYRPVMALRSEKPSIAVRCNPLLYSLVQHSKASTPYTSLNYRM